MPEIDGRVILLIVFVTISAVKWLMEKIQGGNQPEPEEEPNSNMENLYEQYREEIRQRQTKLQKKPPTPTPPAPPPPPAPPALPVSATPQPQRSPDAYRQPNQQRPATSLERPVNAKQSAAPVYTPRKTVVSAEQRAAASRFERSSSSRRKPSAQNYVRTLLSTPESSRQAIILSEILGKPKSIQGG